MMGRNHARVYSELKAVDSLYLYDLNREAARDLAEAFGATVSSSIEDLLGGVDAVSVCVPTSYHFEIAEQVLDAGVSLLIEKPICATADESRRLIQMIPDGLVTGIGHIERFNPILPEIKKIVRNPLYIEIKRHNPASARVNSSSVVEDLMIHDVDIVRNVLL
ncbi:Gfo/Idh/MocA family protein, partial [Methanoculleus sp. DTU007]|uniref:Gfo/Idh/MocA family protein n=1 Tax=Methanoculleus sp. DTU007 TaxID=1671626 RepID=UPI00257A09D0